jgi:tetratricopeptide (TPR) repeat protein
LEIKKFFARYRWFFLREGFLYLLVLGVALMCVDVPGVVQSVKIRKLNDLVTGMDMSQLYSFSKGDIPASAVDWERVTTYLRMVMKFFPAQEDAEMFLGFCEYYGLGQDNMPYYFWNVYDTGLMLFKTGDMDHAMLYLELALLAPGDKMLAAMGNSIIYRQFFSETLNSGLEVRLNRARENAVLLLAAANFVKHNLDTAQVIAMKGVTESDIKNREPFYFYAGAIAMARGDNDKALPFFEQAIKLGSRNFLVYRYAAGILRKKGREKDAQKIEQEGQAFDQGVGDDQFPYPKRLRLEFY